jgi:hypothetical protein
MNSVDDLAVVLRFLFAEAIDERWRAMREKRAEDELLKRIRALRSVKTFVREWGYAVYGPTTKLGQDLVEAAQRAHEAGEWLSCRRLCELTEDEMGRRTGSLVRRGRAAADARALAAASRRLSA